MFQIDCLTPICFDVNMAHQQRCYQCHGLNPRLHQYSDFIQTTQVVNSSCRACFYFLYPCQRMGTILCWLLAGFPFYGPGTEVIHIDGSMLYLDGWSSREVFLLVWSYSVQKEQLINLNAQLLYLLQAAACLCESGRTVVKLKKTRIHLNFDLYPAHMRHPTRLSFSHTPWWYVLG